MGWILFCLILLVGMLAFAGYVFRNLTYDETAVKRMFRAGITEKQVMLPDGTKLNYGEGGSPEAPPLLLIHGQGVTWKDYAGTLPLLVRSFHVFAVDCHGHGKSSFQPEKYTAAAMGADFLWLIREVVGEPVYVSGHSSGGLLTVWLAANAPDWVRGIVVEDTPLFSTEPPEKERTFAYRGSFCLIHDYLQQTEESDYLRYYLDHCLFRELIGGAWPKMMRSLERYRARYPDRKPKVWWLPPAVNAIWLSVSDPYDPRFGETFFDQSWFAGFHQAEALAAIRCPAIFLKAATRWKDGVLLAALSEEDCRRVCALIPNCRRIDFPKAGHDIHVERPKDFAAALEAMKELRES